MNSSLSSAVRFSFNTVRYAEIYNERKPPEEKKIVGHISLIETGDQATCCGSGEIYEKFKQSDFYQKYLAENEKRAGFF